jgi:hypothetical protein
VPALAGLESHEEGHRNYYLGTQDPHVLE